MSPKDKNLVGVIIISIAIFMCFYFVLPSYDKIQLFKAAVESRQSLLDSRSQTMNNLEKLKTYYDENKEHIDKISIIIPSKKHVPELISALESLSLSTGLALTNLDITEGANSDENPSIKNLLVSTKMAGSYDSYKNFLTSIETSQRLVDVESSKVNLDKDSLVIELTGKSYVLTNKINAKQ